jgi:hypothetical protein
MPSDFAKARKSQYSCHGKRVSAGGFWPWGYIRILMYLLIVGFYLPQELCGSAIGKLEQPLKLA